MFSEGKASLCINHPDSVSADKNPEKRIEDTEKITERIGEELTNRGFIGCPDNHPTEKENASGGINPFLRFGYRLIIIYS